MKTLISRTILLVLLFLSLFAALKGTAQSQKANAFSQNAPLKADETKEGEQRFRTNCGRCHHPPEDLSPREARAVIRQMRVRAMLTAEDERLILKFLAP